MPAMTLRIAGATSFCLWIEGFDLSDVVLFDFRRENGTSKVMAKQENCYSNHLLTRATRINNPRVGWGGIALFRELGEKTGPTRVGLFQTGNPARLTWIPFCTRGTSSSVPTV